MKKNIVEAIKCLDRAKEISNTIKSPFKGLSLNKAIDKMRKVREALWEEKLAIGPRHK